MFIIYVSSRFNNVCSEYINYTQIIGHKMTKMKKCFGTLTILLCCLFILKICYKLKMSLDFGFEYGIWLNKTNSTLSSKIPVNCSYYQENYQENLWLKSMFSKYALNRVILLSVTDMGNIDLSKNLYQSLKRFNIENYLFLCSNKKCQQHLASRNINAITLWNDPAQYHSIFGTKDYIRKVYYKVEAAYRGLCFGYITLMIDADIVFINNPIPYMMQFTTHYNLIIQNEPDQMNTGNI